jgi:Family of unknown function (DUF6178)
MTSMTRYTSPGAGRLLARVLERPDLVRAVRALPPRALAKLIDHVGLEDSGEIVALATTEQLAQVFDEDLWRSARPGDDETFDDERFALWLEILLEAGDEFAADRLAELSEDFVIMAVQRHALVVDLDELAVEMSNRGECDDDRDMTEKALESCLYQEIDHYRVIARRHEGWDALAMVLLALDKNHRALLERILERCASMSSKYIEDNGGLYDVLSSEDMLESDVAGEREDRRAAQGFIAPASARSFLALARKVDVRESPAGEKDAVTRAYFRELDRTAAGSTSRKGAREAREAKDSLENLVHALEAAEAFEEAKEAELVRPRPQLRSGPNRRKNATAGEPVAEPPLFRRALEEVAAEDPKAYGEVLEELAYLVNVLVAGSPFRGRAFRPSEAAEAVVAVCSVGLAHLVTAKTERARTKSAANLLRSDGAVRAFRLGWFVLARDASLSDEWPALDGLSIR